MPWSVDINENLQLHPVFYKIYSNAPVIIKKIYWRKEIIFYESAEL